jgi:predicted nucleic acid-binding Zn ribbon protein
VFGSVGVTFKGSGFYRTDSREKPASSSSTSSSSSSE